METRKQNWIDETLESTQGIKSIGISESLRKRLENIPSEVEVFNKTIPMKAVWLAAASIALLLTVNVIAVKKDKTSSETQQSSLYTNYFSYLDQL